MSPLASGKVPPLGRRPSPTRDAPSSEGIESRDFDHLIRPHLQRMQQIAMRVLGCQDLAWDAVQEALIALWHDGRVPNDHVPWLMGAVWKRSLHRLRTERRRSFHEHRVARERSVSCPDRALDCASCTEFEERIRAALRTLPPKLRRPLELQVFEDRDYVSIANSLDVPVGTVRSRLSRARRFLERALESQENAPSQPANRRSG